VGREKDEIEITPEMIEAGFAVLKASGLTDDPLEADKLVVADIFRAMALISPASFGRQSP
jgi:hypothetical protein